MIVIEPPVLGDEEHHLRLTLWLCHGHTMMYGDDGEMHCGECMAYGEVDYRRAPLDALWETVKRVMITKEVLRPRWLRTPETVVNP